jgi:molecular chaperone GrpE
MVSVSEETYGAPPSPADPQPQTVESLARALAEAEAKAKENLDGWQRERASFANYRRRSEQERAGLASEGCADAICRLLPVLDDLERACESVPAQLRGETWVQGVCMVLRKFEQAIESLGVQPIEAEGQRFDPAIHEAITHEESDEHAEGEVVGEVARGFRLGDRVLRCSRVRVARGRTD